MKNLVIRFANDRFGSATLEFGLLAVGTAIAIFAILRRLGKKMANAPEVSDDITPNRSGKAGTWRDSLPTVSEVHVASVMQIAKERRARRSKSAT